MSIFTGSGVALSTPFHETGVNFDALGKLIDFQIENLTDALVICGTTGEPSTMTEEEKLSAIEYTVKKTAKRVPVIAGTGGNDTKEVIRMSAEAEKLGADALLIVTPYYNKCSQKGLVKHFFAVADVVNIPIIIYNVPVRTGFNITPKMLLELSAHPNIQAVKEASANIVQIVEMARMCEGKIDIYSGNDDHVIPMMAVGALGVISVTANVLPKEMHDMAAKFLAGDTKGAMALQFRLNPLTNALFTEVNPIPVKTALNLMGFDMGRLRLPLCEMADENLMVLKKELKAMGLIG
jgi:4-hydroxy-tetrahydrodipicolinate synthase